jgi:hypothetical protein
MNADPLCHVSHLSPDWQETFDQDPGIEYLVFMGPNGSLIRKYEDKKGTLRKCKYTMVNPPSISIQLITVALIQTINV